MDWPHPAPERGVAGIAVLLIVWLGIGVLARRATALSTQSAWELRESEHRRGDHPRRAG